MISGMMRSVWFLLSPSVSFVFFSFNENLPLSQPIRGFLWIILRFLMVGVVIKMIMIIMMMIIMRKGMMMMMMMMILMMNYYNDNDTDDEL